MPNRYGARVSDCHMKQPLLQDGENRSSITLDLRDVGKVQQRPIGALPGQELARIGHV